MERTALADLRFATYLAPTLLPVYAAAAEQIGRRLGLTTDLVEKDSSLTYGDDDHDVSFVCSLPVVLAERAGAAAGVPTAAPVLLGARYGGRPVYYSDVVVRADSDIRSFEELGGRTWAFNQPDSQSGYGAVRHHLVEEGVTDGFFAETLRTGSHAASIALVRAGSADGAAIDSHVLALLFRDEPDLATDLRVVSALGPLPIQPVTVSRRLPADVRAAIGASFAQLHREEAMRQLLGRHLIERFVPIGPDAYQPVHHMLDAAERVGYVEIRA